MNSARKYGRIELDFLPETPNDEVKTESFEDCGMFITGDRIVIVIDRKDSIQSTEVTRGIIFPLYQIKEYRTYKS